MDEVMVHCIYCFPTRTGMGAHLGSINQLFNKNLLDQEIGDILKLSNPKIQSICKLYKHELGGKDEYCCSDCCNERIKNKEYELEGHYLNIKDKITCVKCKEIYNKNIKL